MTNPDENKAVIRRDQRLKRPLDESRTKEELEMHEKKSKEAEAIAAYKSSIDSFRCSLDSPPRNGILSRVFLCGHIAFLVFFSYFLGKFRFGISGAIGLAYAGMFFYSRLLEKMKFSMKSLIFREARKEKTKNNWETVEWLNYAISRVWHNIEPVISKEVFIQVNPLLASKKPPIVNDLRLSQFTLGSHPPCVVGICYFQTEMDTIMLEAEVEFVPLDMTTDTYSFITRKRGQQWNSKIVLKARLGAKMKIAGTTLSFIVKNLCFQGRMRFILKLQRDKILIKTAEICFMELPHINFDLVPLNTLDLKELPLLGTWIDEVVKTGLSKTVVNPNSITVDLTKPSTERSVPIGVILINIGKVHLKQKEKLEAKIGIDGKEEFQTCTKEGAGFIYNEFFYLIVENTDVVVNVKLVRKHGESEDFFGEGNISIRKVRGIKNHLEGVRIYKKDRIRAIVDTHLIYLPLNSEIKKDIKEGKDKEFPEDAGIVKMRVLGVDDLPEIKGSDFSCMFTLLACPKLSKQAEKDEDFLSGAVNATALLVGGAINTAGSVINFLNPASKARRRELWPSSKSTFYLHKSKIVDEKHFIYFNEECLFLCRNMKTDWVYLTLQQTASSKNKNILGSVDLPIFELRSADEYHKLRNSQGGRIQIQTSVSHLSLHHFGTFCSFNFALRLRIMGLVSLYKEGVFYILVYNGENVFYTDPFFVGDIVLVREIIVPVTENEVRFEVYRETTNEDEFLGHGKIDLDDVKLCDDKSAAHKVKQKAKTEDGEEKVATTFSTRTQHSTLNDQEMTYKDCSKKIVLEDRNEESAVLNVLVDKAHLVDYKGGDHTQESFKVIQIKFNQFSGVEDEFIIEFSQNNEVIKRSNISKKFRITETFVFLAGKSEIRAMFKPAILGSNEVIGDCLIPKREMHEDVLLNDGRFKANIEIAVKSCAFLQHETFKYGYCTLTLKGAQVNRDTSIDAFINVSLTTNSIHTTKTKRNVTSFEINEEVLFDCKMNHDLLSFELWDYNSFDKNTLIGYRELPLYFLKKGLTDIDLTLFDPETCQRQTATLQLAFKYEKERQDEKGRKIKSSFKTL